jgi:hypothetical protein
MNEARRFADEKEGPITHDEQMALLKLDHADNVMKNLDAELESKMAFWDAATYLAVCTHMAEIMRCWALNFGFEDEFKEWVIGYFNDDTRRGDLRRQVFNNKVKLLLHVASKERQALDDAA